MTRTIYALLVVGVLLAGTGTSLAEVVIDWATVGNPGNADDTHGDGYGGVDYVYQIGKYEITAGQYTEFLNAVADTDTYELYNLDMWDVYQGCKIQRSGSKGTYGYSVASDYANRPVNYISFWDMCRFSNWLHNGQPTGLQSSSTTEDGAYTLTPEGMAANTVTRNINATIVLPNEDEWYKAAYYDLTLNSGNGGYWDYATRSDDLPIAELPPGRSDYPRSANHDRIADNHTTEVGAYLYSNSAYGTFDQTGNIVERNETSEGMGRCLRGGGFTIDSWDSEWIPASYRNVSYLPTEEQSTMGFRLAQVPEPSTILLLCFGGFLFLKRNKQ